MNQPHNVENGHEEIPLNRMTSAEEREEAAQRQRIRQIFNEIDRNKDGYINRGELKRYVQQHPQNDTIPSGFARVILSDHDDNNDGHLDFDEFVQLYKAHNWLFKSLLVRYCKFIVPCPHREQSVETDQIDGAYERSMTFCPPPITMILFSILEIVVFLVDVFHFKDDPNNTKEVGERTTGPAATLFIYNPFRREEAWRFITYMLVHVGIMHILMNLIIQIFLGVALELVHCWWRVSLVYLAGVAAGSMGTSITDPRIFLAGASGGVYALITAHISTIIMNWHEMEYACVQLFVFLIFCATDFGLSLYRHLSDVRDQVGYMAHLSGAVAGLLVGIGVLRNLKVRRWERILWWFAVTVYVLLMTAAICVHIFYPRHFPSSTTRLAQFG